LLVPLKLGLKIGSSTLGSQIPHERFWPGKQYFIWCFCSRYLVQYRSFLSSFAGFHRGLAFSEAALFETIPDVPQ
jgi:hypothetical protein